MSIKIMSRVWEHADSSLGELLVLLAIADHANDHGFAWPGVESLAKKSRLSERQTRYIIRNLEAKGYIKTLLNEGPRGTNMYQVILGEGAVSAPGAVCDREGGSLRHKGGQPIAPESSGTVTEPSLQLELVKKEACDWGKICPCLETSPKAKDLWHQWMRDRRKHKKPAIEWLEFFARQAHWLKQFDSMTVIEILEKSVVNGYQGLFEPKKAKKQSSGESATQEMSRILKGIT